MDNKIYLNILGKIPEVKKQCTDYIKNGLIYCWKCNTPKQYKCLVEIGRATYPVTLPALCKCQTEERRRREEKELLKAKVKHIEFLRLNSMMSDKDLRLKFSDIHENADNKHIKTLSVKYVDKFDEMQKKNQGLLFYGDVGTGKTYTASCIASELIRREKAVIMNCTAEFLRLLQSFDTANNVSERLNNCLLLIIDDLGSERDTSFAYEKIYGIIDNRYRAGKPVIITTNMSINEMQSEPAVQKRRIYERILETCYPIRFQGLSYRKKQANARFEEMRKFINA